jgi:histone deacetylase 1/2
VGAPPPPTTRGPDPRQTTGGYDGGYPSQNNSGGYGGGYTGQNHGGNGGGGQNRNGGGGKKQRPRCQICKYWGHEAYQCRNRFNQEFRVDKSNQRAGNAATMSHPGAPWLMDSGSTDHITSDLERLHMHERYGGTDTVQVANGKGLSISHIGNLTLAGSKLLLNHILHVPHFSHHLLSVYRLVCDNDVFVEFHCHFFCVKDKATRKILLHGRSHGGLYPIPLSRASSSASSRRASSGVRVSASQWHQRLGHPSNKVVKTVVKNHELPCLPFENSESVCDACQCAKSHQLSYTSSERVSTMPLELVHSDVWGPAIASPGGYKYYVSFIDDYSRFCWIYLLKHKSDVEQVFYAFQAHVERLLDAKIKVVQSDWGGEYHRLHSYFQRTGIVHRVSCSHTSQQNGIAERKHRHLVETGLDLLAHSSTPLRFWDEAYLTACYLINRMPTSVLQNETPIFRLLKI